VLYEMPIPALADPVVVVVVVVSLVDSVDSRRKQAPRLA
jgi:hypothetical protein